MLHLDTSIEFHIMQMRRKTWLFFSQHTVSLTKTCYYFLSINVLVKCLFPFTLKCTTALRPCTDFWVAIGVINVIDKAPSQYQLRRCLSMDLPKCDTPGLGHRWGTVSSRLWSAGLGTPVFLSREQFNVRLTSIDSLLSSAYNNYNQHTTSDEHLQCTH